MRKFFLMLGVIVVIAATLAAPASAGGANLLGGVSWPLYSEREVEMHAGLSQHLKLTDQAGSGVVRAVPRIDPAVIPMDSRYGFFNDIRYLRVLLRVMGIDEAQVRSRQLVMEECEGEKMARDGYDLVVDLQALTPDEKIIVAEVVQDASRVESEVNLILFKIKSVRHVRTTDRVVQRFLLIDAANWIEWAVPKMFGDGTCPKDLNDDQRELVRAAFMADQCGDTLQFTRPLPKYELQADFMTRALQGAPAPFQALESTPYGQAMAEVAQLKQQYEEGIANLQAAEQRRADEVERQRRQAEERAQQDRARTEAEATATRWPEQVRARFAGKTGFMFVAVDDNWRPTCQPMTLYLWEYHRDGSWRVNSAYPKCFEDGEGIWFWDAGCPPTTKWLGIGLSNSPDCQPSVPFSLHSNGLRIIAVQQGGVVREVQ